EGIAFRKQVQLKPVKVGDGLFAGDGAQQQGIRAERRFNPERPGGLRKSNRTHTSTPSNTRRYYPQTARRLWSFQPGNRPTPSPVAPMSPRNRLSRDRTRHSPASVANSIPNL